jgi:N,N'-diacetyllegionaminate synthase
MAQCFIIAEAGVNHNGDVDAGRKLIDAAAQAGANAVKFQTFKAEEIASQSAPKAPYQTAATGSGSQLEMLRTLELSEEDHFRLKEHAESQNIQFCSTAFDPSSVDFLEALGVPFFKIPSGEITNYPLITHIAGKSKPVILSTGMSTLTEVKTALSWLGDGPQPSASLPNISILHCVSAYPAPADAVNLKCLQSLSQSLQHAVGYSDHSLGIEIPIAAVAVGASVLEKHFTLDRTLPGPDHKASLEPAELIEMIRAIRLVESALGDGEKKPAACELENLNTVRRGIVAALPIKTGERFSEKNITVRRPARGLPASEWPRIIGQAADRDFKINEPIEQS